MALATQPPSSAVVKRNSTAIHLLPLRTLVASYRMNFTCPPHVSSSVFCVNHVFFFFFCTPRILLNCSVPWFRLWSSLALPNRVPRLCTACFCRKFEKSVEISVTMKPIKDSPILTKEAVLRGVGLYCQPYAKCVVGPNDGLLCSVRYSFRGFLLNE